MCILVPPLSLKLQIFMNLHTFSFPSNHKWACNWEPLSIPSPMQKTPKTSQMTNYARIYGPGKRGEGGGVWIPPVENSNFLNSNSEVTKLGIGQHFSFENRIKYFLDTPPLKKMLDPRFNDTRDVYTTQGRIYLYIHPWSHVQLNQVRIYYSSICKIVQTMGTNCRYCGKWNLS